MSCGCHDHPPTALSAVPVDPRKPKKKPCGPCAQAARAIASAMPDGGMVRLAPVQVSRAGRLGVAATDLNTIQTFLATLSPGVSPTTEEVTAAQTAASNLSTEIPDANTTTLPTLSLFFIAAGAVIGGVTLAYLARPAPSTSRRTARRR
jgi:hypothetical protein